MPPINTFVEIGLGSGYDSFVNVVVGKYRKEYVKKHFVSRNSCMAWLDGYKWIFKKIILTKKKVEPIQLSISWIQLRFFWIIWFSSKLIY